MSRTWPPELIRPSEGAPPWTNPDELPEDPVRDLRDSPRVARRVTPAGELAASVAVPRPQSTCQDVQRRRDSTQPARCSRRAFARSTSQGEPRWGRERRWSCRDEPALGESVRPPRSEQNDWCREMKRSRGICLRSGESPPVVAAARRPWGSVQSEPGRPVAIRGRWPGQRSMAVPVAARPRRSRVVPGPPRWCRPAVQLIGRAPDSKPPAQRWGASQRRAHSVRSDSCRGPARQAWPPPSGPPRTPGGMPRVTRGP